ncbi:MAG: N-acetylmuramoyl-L-alanine amidase [Chloroflexota bacterium]
MRQNLLQQIQRLFGYISTIALIILVVVILSTAIINNLSSISALTDWFPTPTPSPPYVAIISGHAAYDPGAVCTDASGQAVLTEAEINATIAKLVVARLQRFGVDVLLLNEYDPRLNRLPADVLLSLHSDSCIAQSGYKAATHRRNRLPEQEARLLACIDEYYPAQTQLPHHPNTITHNMTEYYAFNRIARTTPAAILEMGFMGGDQALLVNRPDVVAAGIVDSLWCFLSEPTTESREEPREERTVEPTAEPTR